MNSPGLEPPLSGGVYRRAERFQIRDLPSSTLLIVLVCLSLLAVPLPGTAGTASGSLLPQACPEGWPREGEVGRFTKETLYEHINGEAELFLPFGFDELSTAAYAGRSGSPMAIIADVYRVGSVLNAFGLYSHYRNSDDAVVHVGAAGSANPAQLLFFQDRYFVRLSASGTAELDLKTLEACAKAISSLLPGPPAMPVELGMLPSGGILPGTVKYSATSLFGYPFFRAGLTADVRVDGQTVKAFVVIEESAEAARKAIDRYDAYLKQSGHASGLNPVEGTEPRSAQDPLYGYIAVLQRGPHIFGLARLSDPAPGLLYITEWAAQLRTP